MTHTQANPANQTNLRKLDKFLGLVLIASALLVALYFTTKANLNLAQDPYFLPGDERITFDGVKELLHPESFLAFIDTIIDGRNNPYPHIYGRILWNISAIFSFLPEKFWGVSGQIIATRFTHAIIQLLAYGLLVFTFIRSWILRGLAILLLVALPYTAYFATMPKPEPIQLLCLALFLAFSARNQFRFGYYWVFLGLAFGAKISALTLLPLFIGLGLLGQISQVDWVDFPVSERQTGLLKKSFRLSLIILGIYQIIHATILFLQGNDAYIVREISNNIEKIARRSTYVSNFIYKVPESLIVLSCIVTILLFGLSLIFIPTVTKYVEQRCWKRLHAYLRVFGVFTLGFCVAVPTVFFKFPLGLTKVFFSTFLTTSHGSDDISITIYSWVKYIFLDYISAPPFLLILLSFAICAILILSLSPLIKNLKAIEATRGNFQRIINEFYPFILLLVPLFCVVPIFLFVDRLWGHYLHVGTIFFVVAFFLCCETLLIPNIQIHLPHRWVVILVVSVLSLQTFITFFYMVPAMAAEMNTYAQRTTTPEFQKRKAGYDYLVSLFQSKASLKGKTLNVYCSLGFIRQSGINMLCPEPIKYTKYWTVKGFNGYFLDWQLEPDLIVMYRENTQDSDSYKFWLAAKTTMLKHVSNADQTCSVKPCYLELSSPYPELLILAKQP